MKLLKKWYYTFRRDRAQAQIAYLLALNCATEKQLVNNSAYKKLKYKEIYYSALLVLLN